MHSNESVYELLGINENSTSREIKEAYIRALDEGKFRSIDEFRKVKDEVDRLYRLRRENGSEKGIEDYSRSFDKGNIPADSFMNLTHKSEPIIEEKKVSPKASSIAAFMRANDEESFENAPSFSDKDIIEPISLPTKDTPLKRLESLFSEYEDLPVKSSKKEETVEKKKKNLRVNEKALKKERRLKIAKKVIIAGIIVVTVMGAVKLHNRIEYIDNLNDYYDTCDTKITYIVQDGDVFNKLQEKMKIEDIHCNIPPSERNIYENETYLHAGDEIKAYVPQDLAEQLQNMGYATIEKGMSK